MAVTLEGGGRWLPMTPNDVETVLGIEQTAYEFPWSRGNFIDSLSADHPSQLLRDSQGQVLGYFVAMQGVDEIHLLNLTVAPAVQGRGHGRHLLRAVVELARRRDARQLWLEVRRHNERAQRIYTQFGFRVSGVRKAYYPAGEGRREDAVVMSLAIGPLTGGSCNALD
jgi:[ribosomal protein S18]-alanine N-acetyltransferase